MNNSVFGKTMKNVRKHRDIKLVTNNKRRSYLILDPDYYTTKCFSENLLVIEMKEIKEMKEMNKTVYLVLSILDISKITMYESLYDDVKPKYRDNNKYLDTDRDIRV